MNTIKEKQSNAQTFHNLKQAGAETPELDINFISTYLQMCLDQAIHESIIKGIWTAILAMLFSLASMIAAIASVVIYKHHPIEGLIVCVSMLMGYSRLTSIDINLVKWFAMNPADRVAKLKSAIKSSDILPIIASVFFIAEGISYHVRHIMPSINVTGAADYWLCYGYPLIVMGVAAIGFIIHNLHMDAWNEYQYLISLDVKNLPVIISKDDNT